MEPKNALQIAGEQLESDPAAIADSPEFTLGLWLGRAQSMTLVKAVCDVGQATAIKRIKESGLYKLKGLTWKSFCPVHLGISAVTADAAIDCVEQYNNRYFDTSRSVPIAPKSFDLIADHYDEKGLNYGGDHIPYSDSRRIKGATLQLLKEVKAARAEAAASRTEIEAAKAETEKVKSDRDNARKAASALRSRVLDLQNPKAFADADDADHKTMLLVQSGVDIALG